MDDWVLTKKQKSANIKGFFQPTVGSYKLQAKIKIYLELKADNLQLYSCSFRVLLSSP